MTSPFDFKGPSQLGKKLQRDATARDNAGKRLPSPTAKRPMNFYSKATPNVFAAENQKN